MRLGDCSGGKRHIQQASPSTNQTKQPTNTDTQTDHWIIGPPSQNKLHPKNYGSGRRHRLVGEGGWLCITCAILDQTIVSQTSFNVCLGTVVSRRISFGEAFLAAGLVDSHMVLALSEGDIDEWIEELCILFTAVCPMNRRSASALRSSSFRYERPLFVSTRHRRKFPWRGHRAEQHTPRPTRFRSLNENHGLHRTVPLVSATFCPQHPKRRRSGLEQHGAQA